VREALKLPQEGGMVLPPVNVTELAESFKVEMAVPGVQRGDFIVEAEGNILSVYVLHKEANNKRFQLHEYNFECVNRHILLPENTDTQFTLAEYKNGVLTMYVPKSAVPAKEIHTRIVVY
jgi:HSP20 family protein